MTLEKLLNILCEKGWKPFGESRINEINRAEQYAGNWNWCCWGSKDAIQRRKSTRQLVSKESGLWQFVCEKDMADDGQRVFKLFDMRGYRHKTIFDDTCEYWLMLSALKDESELEEFLLENIKVK